MTTSTAYKQIYAIYDNDAWATPPDVFEKLDKEFHFTLDVCADGDNTKCCEYISKEANGLTQSWGADVCFMNPPYSQVDQWLEKAYHESQKGATVVCLIKADVSTKWWHKFYRLATEVRFWVGRIQFIPPRGYCSKSGNTKPSSPNMGSAILIFRPSSRT